MTTKKLKIGIIGLGGIARAHIAAYLQNPFVELYAFSSPNHARVQRLGEEFGVDHCYATVKEMLALPALDAVSVCSINASHATCAIQALQAGKHVLCEKPMALSAAEAAEMQRIAEEHNRLLMIGFVRRFGSDCKTLKDLIALDRLGDIYYAKAYYLRRNGNPGGWFGNAALSGGGPLIDLGVHVIDLTRYLLGNPKPISVYGATFSRLGNRSHLKDKKAYLSINARPDDICDVEDMVSALIRFDNGAVLQLEASFSLNLKEDKQGIELFGDKGGAKLAGGLELYTEQDGYLTDITFPSFQSDASENRFSSQINHFVDCILNKTPCISPAEDGVTLMRILDGIYASAKSGHEVILD